MSDSRAAPFALPIEVRMSNAEAFWRRGGSSSSDGGTTSLSLSVKGNTAIVTRSFSGGGGSQTQATLSGEYDGNRISAAGREQAVGYRDCTLTLTRG